MVRVFLFGIDGASPELIFDRWKNHLPNIRKLMDGGCYAKLNSTIPPLTIVAWNSMISGRDASEIGLFGYTYKDSGGNSKLASSRNIKCELVWDVLGRNNKRTVALYVPLSYPVKPINGCMVSDFLTPSVDSNCAYPTSLKRKIKSFGNTEIFFDVVAGLAGHKSLKPDELIRRTYEMTDMQISLLKDLMLNEKWDFFMSVMIGTDRLQHMLWRDFDETHRRHIPDSYYKNALLDYYIYLDKKLGEILELLDDDTTIIVASDHGMVKQDGKININNWLIQEGYLVLKKGVDLSKKQRFDVSLVDMEKTIAYGGGVYQARVYINAEKVGNGYHKILKEMADKIKKIKDDRGRRLNTKVYRKHEIYNNLDVDGCPDLTVYFDDLRWASNPDLSNVGLYSWETTMGADSAGHSRQGCFIISGPRIKKKGKMLDMDINRVYPTLLHLFDIKAPSDVKAKKIEV